MSNWQLLSNFFSMRSLSEWCRFVWKKFMSRTKAHLQGRFNGMPCVNTRRTPNAMPKIEKQIVYAIVSEAHTHATIHFTFTSLHTNRSAIMYSIFLSLAVCRSILTAFDFHSSAINVRHSQQNKRWARFRLDFLFYSFASSTILLCGARRQWAGGLAFGWHAACTPKKSEQRMNRIDNSHTTHGCSPFSLSTMSSGMR